MPASNDPLLQPYQLKHLTLRNRIMSTSHEPSYSEDGMPKDRYRLYHVEKAKGGIALTMTAGSAVVSPDSPPVFGNLLAYKDEIVPWMRRLADECHEHGARGDDPAHPSRPPHRLEQGRLAARAGPLADPRAGAPLVSEGGGGLGHRPHRRRLRAPRRSACRRPASTGWRSTPTATCPTSSGRRPPTSATTRTAAASTTGCAFTLRVLEAMRAAVGPRLPLGVRMVADEDWDDRPVARRGHGDRAAACAPPA